MVRELVRLVDLEIVIGHIIIEQKRVPAVLRLHSCVQVLQKSRPPLKKVVQGPIYVLQRIASIYKEDAPPLPGSLLRVGEERPVKDQHLEKGIEVCLKFFVSSAVV